MKRKALFSIILAAIMLTACGKGSNEAADGNEQTTTASEVAATAETAVEGTTATEMETTAAKPVVFSADERFKYYPLEIIYTKKQETDITAESIDIDEEFANPDGYCVVDFSAKYPVFRSDSINNTVLDKINGEIKTYIDARYEGWQLLAENTTEEKDTCFFDTELYELVKFIYQVDISIDNENSDCKGFDVCGNVLSVNFVDYYYGAGAAHGFDIPVIMMFDLTTGDLLNISQLLSDREGFEDKVRDKSAEYGWPVPLTNDDEVITEYNESVDKMSADGEMLETVIVLADENNYRYSVKDGCICFYLAPYEYGSGGDGIRRVEMLISEMLPFMNDEGRAIFEGMTSATTEPAMVMIENDEKKIISREQAAEMLSEGEE